MTLLCVVWALLRSTVDWRVAAVAALAVSLLAGAYAKGHGDAAATYRAADLARQLATEKQIAERLQAQAQDASARAAAIEALGANLTKKVNEYERAVRLSGPLVLQPGAGSVPPGACVLGGVDADRLRAIQ